MALHPPFKQHGTTYVWNPHTNSYYPTNTPSAGAIAHNVQAEQGNIPDVPYSPMYGNSNTPYQIPDLPPHPQPSTLKLNGKNTKQVQDFLRAAGFPIHADGKIGPATKSALQYYMKNKSSKGWSPPTDATVVTSHPNGTVTRGAKVGNGTNVVGDNAGGSGGKGVPDAGLGSKIPGLPSPNVGNLIPEGLINSMGAKTYDPSFADSLAGAQFDSQIKGANRQIHNAPIDAAQHEKDIANWYGQVQKSLKTAASRNADAASAATSTIGNTSRDILSSIGGSANQGAQTVAAQGQADAAMQAQLGQNEAQYANDLSPILTNEAAGQKTNQQNRDTNYLHDLQAQLSDLKGQRGQAKSNALFQIQGMNNDVLNQRLQNLLGIKGTNNSILQQRFQNSLSAQTAAIAAAMSNAQIGYYKASTNATNAAGNGFTPWAKLNPAQKQQLIQAAMGNVVDNTGALMGDPNAARGSVSQYLQGQGYNGILHPNIGPGAQMTGMINSALQHAQALLAQRKAAAEAAGTSYNGG